MSDRLVSRNASPFDPLANKTVVYAARRGVIAIGAAGLAYFGGKPMDRWVAETLTGRDLSDSGVLGLGPMTSRPLDAGQAIELLRREAEVAMAREPAQCRKTFTEFQIVGSQWDRRQGRVRPVMCKVSNGAERTQFRKWSIPRVWPSAGGVYGIATGTQPDIAMGYVRSRLAKSRNMAVEQCLGIMVDAIRNVATACPGQVGRDLMTVHVDSTSREVNIRFEPYTQYRLRSDQSERNHPVAFTPYVITGEGIASPALSSNSLYFAPPGIDARFDGGPRVGLDERPAGLWHQDRRTWRP